MAYSVLFEKYITVNYYLIV